jgi:ribonuclease Z
MKPTFIHHLVNSPFEDPVLFVRIMRERRAFLFDIGNIERLHPGDLQKITDVFVSHTHVDHFIGFDTLLRALLRREIPLRIYGPSSISDCVEGKLRGYTWNVIHEYPLKIDVYSIDDQHIRLSQFYAENGFHRKDVANFPFNGILLKEPLVTVKSVQLEHQIPCLAFSIDEEFHINIDKAALQEIGLPVGPWLAELKMAIRENRPEKSELEVAHKSFTIQELKKITKITRGQKISYVTDVSLNEENINTITAFIRGSDTFYCEAYFLEKDRERALERSHLTSKITGMIARNAGVKQLVVMHCSPKYRNDSYTPAEEAYEEFKRATS